MTQRRFLEVKMMLKNMTRLRLIQVWFATVVLVVLAGLALGVSMTIGTGVMLLVLSLVPAAIVLMLWPGIQPRTASEVLHGADRPERGPSRR
jgi:hypothetical protein